MDPANIALVQCALLNYRFIETKPSGTRAGSPGEARAANLLEEASEEDFSFIRNLLAAQGLLLFRYTSMDMPGIRDTAYGVVHIDPPDGVPGLLTSKMFFDTLKQRRAFRDIQSNTALAGWWMVLWLTAMGKLYQDRHWGEISKFSAAYLDGASFTAEVDTVLSRAQELVVQGAGSWLCHTLVGEDATKRPSRSRVDARCFDFLQALVDAGWLAPLAEERRYRQTLLGAVDVAEKMRRQFSPVLPTPDVLGVSANVLMNVGVAAASEEEDVDVCD